LYQGGTEIQTLTLIHILRRFDIWVDVLCYFEHDKRIVAELTKLGVHVKLLNLNRSFNLLMVIVKIKNEINKINPDIVHIQYLAPGALPIIAARLAGVKTVFATVHQPWTKSHGIFSKLILRAASLLTTKFIAVSQYSEKSWFGSSNMFYENKPSILQPHHFTVHNAVDAEKILGLTAGIDSVMLRSNIGISSDILVVGAISRLRQEKGIDILIEAFSNLLHNNLKVHLMIVGSGPDEDKLKYTVHMLQINDYVTFYGSATWETAMGLLAIMDIVVVPSRFEGFGLTAAEAMAAGKAVIATATSGLKEVVSHGETGLLFPSNDSLALKEGIDKLARDSSLRLQFGKAGKERIKTKFNLDIYARKIKTLYTI
jgi:glycosyltransferase involved in cell wall biosynthesis